MVVSVLIRVDQNGQVEIVDGGPTLTAAVDADGGDTPKPRQSPTPGKTCTETTYGAGCLETPGPPNP